jgi:hypothetical protein
MRHSTVSANPAAAADAPDEIGPRQVVPSTSEFLLRVAERFGVPVVLLCIVLYWARTDLIQPLLDAHFSFLGKITEANEQHTEELRGIGDKLERLIRVTEK